MKGMVNAPSNCHRSQTRGNWCLLHRAWSDWDGVERLCANLCQLSRQFRPLEPCASLSPLAIRHDEMTRLPPALPAIAWFQPTRGPAAAPPRSIKGFCRPRFCGCGFPSEWLWCTDWTRAIYVEPAKPAPTAILPKVRHRTRQPDELGFDVRSTLFQLIGVDWTQIDGIGPYLAVRLISRTRDWSIPVAVCKAFHIVAHTFSGQQNQRW